MVVTDVQDHWDAAPMAGLDEHLQPVGAAGGLVGGKEMRGAGRLGRPAREPDMLQGDPTRSKNRIVPRVPAGAQSFVHGLSSFHRRFRPQWPRGSFRRAHRRGCPIGKSFLFLRYRTKLGCGTLSRHRHPWTATSGWPSIRPRFGRRRSNCHIAGRSQTGLRLGLA
jgi:hypothetical protein